MINRAISVVVWIGIILILGCSSSSKWFLQDKIYLTDISPIGIAADGGFLWLSDVAGNRLVKIDTIGEIQQEYKDIKRPMHFAIFQSKFYVPEYETDKIVILDNRESQFLQLGEQLDAPAAVAVDGNSIAVADFYNHRIILKQKEKTYIIGKEGHHTNEFYYPTDVAWYKNQLYVADAYNNRIQVFDKQGKYLKTIGENDDIQVATGLTVVEGQLFVADFDGNRILIYHTNGELQQIITEGLNKPVDILVLGNIFWVANNGDGTLVKYELSP